MTLDPLLSTQIIKLLLAAVLSGAIGIERLLTDKPAGLRTCMIIGISSCLFTIASVDGFRAYGGIYDPSRVAAQIVVGVGFLGGGSLLQAHNHVLGLTTAATIWIVAAVGMIAGLGMYGLAIAVSCISVFILMGLAPVSNWLERKFSFHYQRYANMGVKKGKDGRKDGRQE